MSASPASSVEWDQVPGDSVLATVPVGGAATVTSLTAADPLIRRRLYDLGFRPGVSVEVVRRAPLGDPRVYRLHGSELMLRRREATGVIVETITTEAIR